MPLFGEQHPAVASLFWNGRLWDLRRAKAKSENLCQTVFCRNEAYLEFRRKGNKVVPVRHSTCAKCNYRRWRINHPLNAAYKELRHSARKRQLAFTLTKEHFALICEQTAYLAFKGTEGCDLHVDRIDATRGYEDGNIQVVTCSVNVAKGNKERTTEDYQNSLLARYLGEVPNNEDPF